MEKLRHEIAKPTYDLVAKKIFSDTEITRHFICDILDIKIKSLQILDGTRIQLLNSEEEVLSGFYTAVDVLAELDNGSQVIIEVQVAKQSAFIKRLWAYICMQVTENIKNLSGDKIKTHSIFKHLCPVYSIAIVEENYFQDDEPYHTFSLYDKQLDKELTVEVGVDKVNESLVKIAFLELRKYKPEKLSEYEKKRWYEFFGNHEFTIQLAEDDIVARAEQLLDMTRWTKEEKDMFDERTRRRHHYYATLEAAREDGMERGREEERSKFEQERNVFAKERNAFAQGVVNLIKMGNVTVEVASEMFNIPISELERELNK